MAVEKILYTDNLRNGTDKINAAIDLSNASKVESASAKTTADGAAAIANTANSKSDATKIQLDTIVLESGTSDAETIQARGLEDLLYKRLDKTDSQLADKADQLDIEEKRGHFAKYTIETAGEPQQDGLDYTAFFSGIVFNGKEIHVGRAGTGHTGNTNVLVAYIREDDGSFTRKKIGGNINYTIGDYRDPNLWFHPISRKLYLSIAVKKIDGTYTNYFCEVNNSYDISVAYEMVGMENHFTWGNSILSSDNFTLRVAYNNVNPNNGVSLFKSGAISGNTIAFTKLLDIFPASVTKPTECTLAQWGDKLIAVSRQNAGSMLYRQTYDLTGATGWGEIITMSITGDAPVIHPFTPKDQPLIIGRCTGGGTYQRSPLFVATYDAKTFSSSLFVDQLQVFGGGYHSFVPNRNGYGIMYYQDGSDPAQQFANSSVFYKEMDVLNLLARDIEYLKSTKTPMSRPTNIFRNNESIAGDCTFIDKMFGSSGNLIEIEFEVKKNMPIKAIELLLMSNGGTSTTAIELYEDGVLLTTSGTQPVAITVKEIYSFPFTATTLQIGKKYKLKLTVSVKIYGKEFSTPFNTVDFGDFVYLTTKYNSALFDKTIVPFGLVRNI